MSQSTTALRTDAAFASECDAQDPLARFRDQFHIPVDESGKPQAYFCGNSLGLMPKTARALIETELDRWARFGVEGHMIGDTNWKDYHQLLTEGGAYLTGAQPNEVVFMNTLTVNLNLLMASFYRPTPERKRILAEGNSFPSDRYALLSQLRLHGHGEEDLVEVFPAEGADTPTTDQFLEIIEREGDSIALLLLGGVNYYTGQVFEMERIVEAVRRKGIVVGLDLAHAAGNIPLRLHDWNVDFAAWCSYKYLNGGPGAVAGAFVHERHGESFGGPRLAGWWGHDLASRFAMPPDFRPMTGAEGWQQSNPPILSMTPLRASLPLFQEAGFEALRAKSRELSGWLRALIASLNRPEVRVLTPAEPHGCQVSVFVEQGGRALFDFMAARGIVADWREPNVIRLAPVPMYNSFGDVHRCYSAMRDFWQA